MNSGMKHHLRRRQLLRWILAHLGASACPAWAAGHSSALRDRREWATANPRRALRLPQDHGPHPDFRTEWWYFTGWLDPVDGRSDDPLGLQVTFFRNAPATATDNPVRAAPRQLLFAHAAVATAQEGTLIHDQIARRTGLADTRLTMPDEHGAFVVQAGNWLLERTRQGDWLAKIQTRNLNLQARFTPGQSPWLQDRDGYSRKGPMPGQASHYITLPHMTTELTAQWSGNVQTRQFRGLTWMDHEWSSSILSEQAAGWDWVGLHGADGSSIMAFRIRPAAPGAAAEAAGTTADIWTHAEMRRADGTRLAFTRVQFQPLQEWTSPRTGARYPVSMRLRLDDRQFDLIALMPDQELDSRMSTGTVYWEGAVRVHETVTGRSGDIPRVVSSGSPNVWGKGYLELTGYWKPMKL